MKARIRLSELLAGKSESEVQRICAALGLYRVPGGRVVRFYCLETRTPMPQEVLQGIANQVVGKLGVVNYEKGTKNGS